MAPFSRIQATAQEVSSPPENAMPTRSPTGSLLKTLDTPLTYGRSALVMAELSGYRYRAATTSGELG